MPEPPDAIRAAFAAFVAGEAFSCLGARAAMNRPSHRVEVYPALGSGAATAALVRDLAAFAASPAAADDFATFVAIFPADPPADEAAFEARLWDQLQRLADADVAPWDPAVSDDPDDPRFSFSVAGVAFFVVGMHPHSARQARRFAYPALAFNPHAQFARLRTDGRYGSLRDAIRDREVALQGSLNPNLSDFGERSDARQYAGGATGDAWRCPFHRP